MSPRSRDHGDPASHLRLPVPEEAGYISGGVFALKFSGRIERYQYPPIISRAQREEGTGYLWTVDELSKVFKKTIIGKDYVSRASKRGLGVRISKWGRVVLDKHGMAFIPK